MEIQDILNPEFNIQAHIALQKMILLGDGVKLTSLDGQRIYVVYFILNSLDALDKIDVVLTLEQKQKIITWIYRQQIIKRTKQTNTLIGGFRGSECFGYHTEYLNEKAEEKEVEEQEIYQDIQTIVFTQCALSCLKILGDNLHLVSRPHILATLKRLQNSNGQMRSCDDSQESDLRYTYSSLVVSQLLQDFTWCNKEQMTQYILSCYNHEQGGFGLNPNMESHGGSTFCAIAALSILNKLQLIPNKTKLIHWLVSRQQLLRESKASLEEAQQIQVEIISEAEYNEQKKLQEQNQKIQNDKQQEMINENEEECQQSNKQNQQILDIVGFQGRVCKFPDSCYTIWIGASLQILGYKQFIASQNILRFLKLCENGKGGFKKSPLELEFCPVHTHFSILGLVLLNKFQCQGEINFSLLIRNIRLN
ncbi:prenyltransferase and squalene oxidase repeat protein (macronuclear) [Tetrahymena thermophila SB210]|uniref:Prenyltransferase and squalene oxidase repeat protein n=1 Tax=Tetrahymena thermophila (strain SB210) TaxID=312017 RepID=Q23AR6_TETTS|nr:prenyltransferase and squalene oxidase repeat protein [Tetrahymena thermophila SB210]EAR93626.1 prenyltransferase and squalene oxidase repeat protein [Tetrahymena thermophila SB210]|eukprot:XP_001013871.1 prenyltransferase and squalene oxidase repeat protein [Tetrahymena thermophila SB210]